MRTFLGEISSLRRVIYLNILEDTHILTSLTSNTKPHVLTKLHKEIFVKVKLAIINQPLINSLIDIAAE